MRGAAERFDRWEEGCLLSLSLLLQVLRHLSNPPSLEELRSFNDVPIESVPKIHKRPDLNRYEDEEEE